MRKLDSSAVSNANLPFSNLHKTTDVVHEQNSNYFNSKYKLSEKTNAYYYVTNTSPKGHNSNSSLISFTKNHSHLNLDKGSSSNKDFNFRRTSCSDKDSIMKICTNAKSGVNTRKISDSSANSSSSMPINPPTTRSTPSSIYNKFNLTDFSTLDHFDLNAVTQDNTEILRLKLSINKEEDIPKSFSLRRYDNLKEKLKIFCETNDISDKLIKPLEQRVLTALSNIYFTYNMKLDSTSTIYLNSLEMRCKNSKIKKLEKNYHSDDCYDDCKEDDLNVSSFSCLTDHVYSDYESCC